MSEVIYGSHSAALITTASTTLKSLLKLNLTKVGKPAPPKPTEPLLRTAATKLVRSLTSGGLTSSLISCKPSGSITTTCTLAPIAVTISSIFCTFPETLACTGAEM